MCKTRCKLLAYLILLICFTNAHAVRLNDLYSSKISVPDKTEKAQKNAFITAFENVLVRSALDKSILSISGISKEIGQVDKYISKYYYSNQDNQIYLNVEFDAPTIHELFKSNNIAYLTEVRPIVSFWLVLEENGFTKIIEGNSNVIAELIANKAVDIGMPIVFPMYDFVDQENINITDILDFNFTKAILAAKRYKSDYIVLGKINKFADEYSSKWHLIDETAPELHFDNKSLEDQLEIVLNQLAMHMVKNYAKNYIDQTTSTLAVYVSGIDNLEKLANIEIYLNELPYVDKLQVGELHDSTVTFNLSLSAGNRENLIKAINLNSSLSLENRPTDLYTVDQLYYRYE